MALKGLDSGEATRFPTFAGRTQTWGKVANQPSAWEVYGTNASYSSMGVSTSDPYTGTTHFRVACTHVSFLSAMRRSFGADFSETYLSFMFKFDSLQATPFFYLYTSSMTIVVRLNVDANGNLLVYAGSVPTLMATIPAGITGGQWYNIKLRVKSGTPGTLQVRFEDGAPVDCSGTNMLDWRYLLLGSPVIGSTFAANYDCIQVNDTTGSINNSWPTSPRIPTALRPTSDTALTDWIRNTGNNDYEAIDETSPDLDTTYLYSQVDEDESAFGLSDLSEPANAVIVGVVLTIVAKRADAANLTPLVIRGGSTAELAQVAVGSDYMTPIEVIMELDPITSAAWTQANLNATVFGFRNEQV